MRRHRGSEAATAYPDETNRGLLCSNAVEDSMPVAIALIIGIAVLAVFLIGVLWAIAVLLPFYAYLGLAVYLVWRSNRNRERQAASMAQEAERQRALNEQETRAWTASLERDQRSASKREKMLRDFDKSREPPAK